MGDFTNGHFDLPPHAKRTISVPIEHRANPRPVAIRVRSKGRKSDAFKSLFRAHTHSA